MTSTSEAMPKKIPNPLKPFCVFFDIAGNKGNLKNPFIEKTPESIDTKIGHWLELNPEFLGTERLRGVAIHLDAYVRNAVMIIERLISSESSRDKQSGTGNDSLLMKLMDLARSYDDEELFLKKEDEPMLAKINKFYGNDDSFFSKLRNQLELQVMSKNDHGSEEGLAKFARENIELKEVEEVAKAVQDLFEKSRKIKESTQKENQFKAGKDWHEHFEARVTNEDFKKELKKLIDTSECLRKFIYAIPTITFAAISVGFIFRLLIDFDVNVETKFIFLEIGLFNLFMVSALSYHLKQVLREIAVLKHLESSYRHRAIVAKTFQSLVASDHFKDEKSEIVVKEAALAMFKKEAQGYLSKDQMEPSNTPLQEIVGIFKNK